MLKIQNEPMRNLKQEGVHVLIKLSNNTDVS